MRAMRVVMVAAALSAAAGLARSAPGPERSGRFADRPTGLVGLDRAVVEFRGGTITYARDGDEFSGFTARDFGTRDRYGLIKVTRPTRGLRVRDVVAERGYRFLDVFTRRADLSDAVVERVRATGLVRGFARVRADSHDIVFRDVHAGFRPEPAVRPELPVGIGLDDTAHDVLIERVVVSGARMAVEEGRYTNGDAFSTERRNRRITFRRAEAYDSSDGGFDLKSADTRLEDTVAARNGRNYRFWGSGTATRITSRDPRDAHIWVAPGARWRIGRLVARGSTRAPLIRIAAGAVLFIDSHDVVLPPGTPLVVAEGDGGPGRVVWGAQGAPREAARRR